MHSAQALLKSGQNVDDIFSEVVYRIAAFHDEDGGQAGRCDGCTHFQEIIAVQLEAGYGIILEGVNPQ